MARRDTELPRRRRQQDDEEREHAQLRKELQEDLRRTRELEVQQFRQFRPPRLHNRVDNRAR